jgi:hypothetical protein
VRLGAAAGGGGSRLDAAEAAAHGLVARVAPDLGAAGVGRVGTDQQLGLALDVDGGQVVEVERGVVAVGDHGAGTVAVVEADAERLVELGVATDVAAGQHAAAALVADPGRARVGRSRAAGGGVVVADRDGEQADDVAEQGQVEGGLGELAGNAHALVLTEGEGRPRANYDRPPGCYEAATSMAGWLVAASSRARSSWWSWPARSGWSRRWRRAACRPRPSRPVP